jgi:hypothetical protein
LTTLFGDVLLAWRTIPIRRRTTFIPVRVLHESEFEEGGWATVPQKCAALYLLRNSAGAESGSERKPRRFAGKCGGLSLPGVGIH